jgi:hypothetical protein
MTTGKVFCIGLNKTATVSLHTALEILGIRSLHWGGPETRQQVLRALGDGAPLLSYLDPSIVAFSDIEDLTYNFDRLDREYPGSRFIFTVRELDPWLDSRETHVRHNRAQYEHGRYDGTFLDVDRDGWAADYRQHARRVSEYFAARPDDLLVLDIPGGDGWEPLCRFLRRPVPDVPFPWRNRSAAWDEVES